MAFWGIEVRPGKPFTQSFGKGCGRLRITQATLGIGASTQRSLVQCNVGDKSPVFLCSLLPDKTESIHLELEFDEVDEVIYSVIGPRSVHLTGYHLRTASTHGFLDDDSDTRGEDIGDADTERSDTHNDDDTYDDSFINDNSDDLVASTPSSISNGVASLEATEDKKQTDVKRGRRLRKKYQLSESDDDEFIPKLKVPTRGRTSQVVESEEEDQKPISSLCKSDNTLNNDKLAQEKVVVEEAELGDKKTTRKGNRVNKSNEVNDAVMVNGDVIRVAEHLDNNMSASVNRVQEPRREKKKKKKRRVNEDNATRDDFANCNEIDGDKVKVDGGKVGKKHDLSAETEHQELEDTKVAERPHSTLPASVNGLQELRTEKKKKKKGRANEGVATKVDSASCNEGVEGKGEVDGGKLDKKHDSSDTEHHEPEHSKQRKRHAVSNVKKRKRGRENEHEVNIDAEEPDKGKTDEKPFGGMSFSNGLVVKEVETGQADGKVAVPGKRVTIHSSLMLKEGSQEVWSTEKTEPTKFRLGKGQIMKGLDLGIDGMRVGGKRRLVIPPALGYGSEGTDGVPPDSWLIMDVELIHVR